MKSACKVNIDKNLTRNYKRIPMYGVFLLKSDLQMQFVVSEAGSKLNPESSRADDSEFSMERKTLSP